MVHNGAITIQSTEGNKRAISFALAQVILKNKSSESSIIDDFVQTSARLVDDDFQILENSKISNEDRKLQSTINTFIPHRDRGKANENKITQSIAEFMIWSEIEYAKTDPNFVQAAEDMKKLTSSITPKDTSSDGELIVLLHIMQTSIRRFRKILNKSSREQGFSLCSSFCMDPKSVTLSVVKRGREGDILYLGKLAKKS